MSFDRTDRLLALSLTIVCPFTRLYLIGRRAVVSWDEKFYGAFGNMYLNRTLFFDVHPPLAKMLVGLSGFISGQNGSLAYPLGTTYPDHVNYTFQRSFIAMLGVTYKMPSQFQALQRNSVVAHQSHGVAYGSLTTLRSDLPGFGLVYVNETFNFPGGDQECIAVGIGGKQKHNWWNLVSTNLTLENSTSPVKHIMDGDLSDFSTRALVTGCAQEVHKPYHLGWGRRMFADGNDTSSSLLALWRVQIESEDSPMPKGQLYAVTTSFRLVAGPDHHKHIESDPWSWPFLLYPMRLVSWADDSIKYYEVGNLPLWWASTLCCLVYPLQMGYWHSGELKKFWDASKLLWGGWALHYLPFFAMARVTYIHHYLLALYFALLLLAFEIQCVARWYMLKVPTWYIAAVAVTAAGFVFYLFSPLTYGWNREIEELAHLRWLPTWNLYASKYDM
ncbi:Protein O-mannosyltransferase 2 [Coemansia aciculifera]|uniref:Dolichyl-phosphate-mannose--protein mannosyltransferase n=1 Tax=Coemansia aciculifera TaxID=417176 RepID=A0A9W8IRM6_9FUNG|nr:Protein O-mannosyltransferase 2 [Coemansia aciculifera]